MLFRSEKEASILRASGEREAATLRAEGFASALQVLYGAARDVDSTAIAVQYLETVRAVAGGPSQKWVVPTDVVEALGRFASGVGATSGPAATAAGTETKTPAP